MEVAGRSLTCEIYIGLTGILVAKITISAACIYLMTLLLVDDFPPPYIVILIFCIAPTLWALFFLLLSHQYYYIPASFITCMRRAPRISSENVFKNLLNASTSKATVVSPPVSRIPFKMSRSANAHVNGGPEIR